MKRLSIILLFFVLVSACGHEDKGFMPDRLLTKQEMMAILADVQIIEADLNRQKNQEREHKDSIPHKPVDYVKLSRSYYDQLFEHYGINDSIFSQNMKYYALHPDDLEIILGSVEQRLLREQQQ